MKKTVWIPLVCIGGIIATLVAAFSCWVGFYTYVRWNTFTNHPCKQPQTTWVTEDGKVELYFNGMAGHGTIQTEDGPVEVAVITSNLSGLVSFYYDEEYQKMTASDEPRGPGFALGSGSVKSARKFVVEFKSADEYFEAGEKLVFYKVTE